MLPKIVSDFALPIAGLLGLFVAIVYLYIRSDANFRGNRFKVLSSVSVYLLIAVSCVTYLTYTIRQKTGEKLLGYAPTYARVMERMQHHRLNENTPGTDSVYLSMIDLQKVWLSANKFVSDIYTMKVNDEGKFYLMVDSETDYDRNGVFEGDREQRTEPGEVYEKDLENLNAAMAGTEVFSSAIVHDRWGSWVSAYVPVRALDGKVDAVLGVDFDAELYLSDQRRMIVLSGLFFEALLGFLLLLERSRVKELSSKEILTQALKLSEEAKETKSRFISTISHEIRTPLNGISGAVEMLGFHPSAAESQTYLRIIQSCSSQLLDLVNDVLDFSKLESEKLVLEKIQINLFELLHSVLDLVRLKAQEKGLRLLADFESLRGNLIEGDPTRIRQIVANLLSNAVKFTAHGSVTLRATLRGESDHRQIEISVTDTGEGISEEAQKRLFQSFSQVDASTTRKYGGTGLGLAISKELAELMGGSLQLESRINEGSTFKLSLKAKTTQGASGEVPMQLTDSNNKVSSVKYRILITDDNDVNRQLLSSYLSKLGHSCRQAKNGREALDFLDRELFDFVFMDGQMPVMDGYEAVKLIREKYLGGTTTRPKIIAITANADSEDKQRFLKCGADAFLLKPATLKQIAEVIGKLAATDSTQRRRIA